MIRNLYFYIAPHFVHRFYLTRDIKAACRETDMRGRVLDVGCGDKPYRHLFTGVADYVGIDFARYSRAKGMGRPGNPDVVFPAGYTRTHRLPFADRSFDHVVSFQVLEHHPDPGAMIAEMSRVTKPGGRIIISAPFVWGLHEEPHDYMRFSHYALVRALNNHGFTVQTVRQQGSLCSLIMTLISVYCFEVAAKNRVLYAFVLLLYPFILILEYVCLPLDRIFASRTVFINYVVTGMKRT